MARQAAARPGCRPGSFLARRRLRPRAQVRDPAAIAVPIPTDELETPLVRNGLVTWRMPPRGRSGPTQGRSSMGLTGFGALAGGGMLFSCCNRTDDYTDLWHKARRAL